MIEKCIEDMPHPQTEEPHLQTTEEPTSDEDETEEHKLRERGGVRAGDESFIVGQSSHTENWRHFADLVAKINRFSRIGKYEKVMINYE